MTDHDAAAAPPALETPRLRLRPHRAADLPACAAMWSDPAVVRYIGGKPMTEQQTWMRIMSYAGEWALLGFGYWALEEKETGAFAGELGFADFKRDIAASMRDVPEAGWALVPRVHGRGYAKEAVRAALAWGDDHLASARTVCMISPENLASIRVAEVCGYRVFERTAFQQQPILYLERPRSANGAGAGTR
jgi:RimJ/RimL family protein N-acetyltransferase